MTDNNLLDSNYKLYNTKTSLDNMSDAGNLNILFNDVNNLISYLENTIKNFNKPSKTEKPIINDLSQQKILIEVLDKNNKNSEYHYVTTIDNKNSNTFEGFQPMKYKEYDVNELKLPKNPIVQLYFAGLASLGIYILYKMSNK